LVVQINQGRSERDAGAVGSFLVGVHPATAVGTDLLYAAITKACGTAVHHQNQILREERRCLATTRNYRSRVVFVADFFNKIGAKATPPRATANNVQPVIIT
jgi:hypothetical protein